MRGAIHANQAAQNYRFRMDMTSSHTSTVASDIFAAKGVLEIRWGGGATHVIKVTVANTYDASLGTPSVQTITIADFWSADTTVTGTAWGTPRAILVEIDNAVLTVASDCDWDLAFDEIRVYVDTVLKKTITTNTDSGTGFDFRNDTVSLTATVQDGITQPTFVGSSSPTSGSCGFSYASYTTRTSSCSCSLEGGWQFKVGSTWTSDTVEINNPSLPTSTCTCVPSPNFPAFVTGHDYDSWYLVAEAYYELNNTKTLGDLERCDCDGADPGYEERQYWDYTYAYQYKIAALHAMPRASLIYDHDYYAYTDCVIDTDTEPSTPATVTESLTYVKQETFSDKRTSLIHCWDLVAAVACLGGNPCNPAFPTLTDAICQTQVTTTVTWPTAPDCLTPAYQRISIDRDAAYTHVRAYLNTSGLVVAGYADNALTWADTTLAFTADDVAVTAARSGDPKRRMLIASGGTITRYKETAPVTWTSELASGTGTKVALVYGSNNVLYEYWLDGTAIKGRVSDAAGTVIVATFTAVATVDANSDVDVTVSEIAGAGYRVTLQVYVSAVLTIKTSTDGGVTFV